MSSIRYVLPVLMSQFPTLCVEFNLFGSVLNGASDGLIDLPAEVMTAAAETIAFAPCKTELERIRAGETWRRMALVDVAIFLMEKGHRPQVNSVATAAGVWGAVVGRGTQMWRGLANERVAPGAPDRAAALGSFLDRAAFDLSLLLREANGRRLLGREAHLVELRERLRAEPSLKRTAPPPKPVRPSPQLSFFLEEEAA